MRSLRITLLPCLALVAGCATTPVHEPPRPSRPPPRPVAERVEPVVSLVEAAARRHGLDVALVLGVIQVESAFNPKTRSSAGAVGLMQLMPRTASALARRLGQSGVPVDEPSFNVEAGCLYLELLLEKFDHDLELALAAYNAGPYRVAGWRAAGRPLPDGSRRYVDAVLAARRVFAADTKLGTARAARAFREDRDGLRDLLRRQQERYPEPPTSPASAPASLPADTRPDDDLEGLPAAPASQPSS